MMLLLMWVHESHHASSRMLRRRTRLQQRLAERHGHA
tara:strand:- start:15 stop:125 length:111 start_codon:yes stop_codon:yes gene_type:complete